MGIKVAPLVGAWIETRKHSKTSLVHLVAPLVGAWIETQEGRQMIADLSKSHPSWVRGLKLITILSDNKLHVAPLVGAWIETIHTTMIEIMIWSHPSWVRGLKLKGVVGY